MLKEKILEETKNLIDYWERMIRKFVTIINKLNYSIYTPRTEADLLPRITN